jgi:hypothetical protein
VFVDGFDDQIGNIHLQDSAEGVEQNGEVQEPFAVPTDEMLGRLLHEDGIHYASRAEDNLEDGEEEDRVVQIYHAEVHVVCSRD